MVIATCALDGTDERLLTEGFDHCDGPDYTPDGVWLWFNGETGGRVCLWRMQPDGTALQRMSGDERVHWFPPLAGRAPCALSRLPGWNEWPSARPRMVELRLMPAGGGAPVVLERIWGGQGSTQRALLGAGLPLGLRLCLLGPAVIRCCLHRAVAPPRRRSAASRNGAARQGSKCSSDLIWAPRREVTPIDDAQTVLAVTVWATVSRPRDGWSEQDPDRWDRRRPHGAGIAGIQGGPVGGQRDRPLGQMHGATLVDANGTALRPANSWNDTRAHAEAATLDADPKFRAITGNIVFPGFTAPKLVWLAAHEPRCSAGWPGCCCRRTTCGSG